MITALFIVIHVIWSKKFDLKVLEKKPADEYLKNVGSKTFKAIPALIMPLIILGGIYGGIITATEAAAVRCNSRDSSEESRYIKPVQLKDSFR